jgi:DNA invertase Pin-like site-specific DNA recombinase
MEQKLKYFIYARKSSEGADRQILSIEGQLNELYKLVQRNNLIVVDTYIESKSAHIPNNRPAFNEMIKKIKKGKAQGIILWHINRISRNPTESGQIQQMLQDGKIVSIVTPYRHFRSEDNALLFSIETSEANQYSRDLSVNVKRGLKQKYEMGHPPGYAQLGYLNTKSSIRGSNKIIVDNERWHIVRKGFELVLSGAYTISQVLDILNNEYGLRTRPGNIKGGKPLSKSGFYRMLVNPFYYGVFYRNGILFKGAYKPMITVQEFDQIQLILGRKGKPRSQKHLFAYTGLIKCGVCGSAITASEKQKLIKSTNALKSYTLYHCTHRKKGAANCTEKYFIPVNILEKQIIEELSNYQVKPIFKDWALTIAKKNSKQEIEKYEKLIAEQSNHENRLHRELNNLVDLRISDGISEIMYLQKKVEKEELLVRVASDKEKLKHQSGNWMQEIEDRFNFTTDIVERFKKADLNTKKEICHDFGWNWTLKEKKLFISKQEWLEPFKKYKDSVERVLSGLEPEKSIVNQRQDILSEYIRPLVCGLVNEVRTDIDKRRLNEENHIEDSNIIPP